MNYIVKSILFWLFAVVFTISIAIYQRMTGPTYPKKGSITIADKEVKFKLLRSQENTKNGVSCDAIIKIENKSKILGGSIVYKRYKTMDDWNEVIMHQNGDYIEGALPSQPAAGKLEYRVFLKYNNENFALNVDPVVIRFTGEVPKYILLPHILFMFLAMLFSTRTGIEAIIKGKHTFNYALVTVITLFLGGIILGPIVQKYAFGAYWTGWPFGKDLTDDKTAVAFLFWVIATFKMYRNREKKGFAIVAMIVLLAVYMIPHSMFGSELDTNTGKVTTGQKI
ncbi:MAG: hypothetical protein ACOYO1_17275 [Bacteroidales bacterium]